MGRKNVKNKDSRDQYRERVEMMETIKGRNIFLKKQKRRPPFQAGNSDCLGKGTNLGGATMDFFGNDMVALDSPQRWRVVVVIVSKGNA